VPKWKTVVKVVLPTAIAGILTGVTLAIARVVVATLKDMDPQWPTLPKEKKDAVKK